MAAKHSEQVRLVEKLIGRVPELRPFGPKSAGYALGFYDDYPDAGLRTTVTFGLAQQGGSMWRGLTLGTELAMTIEGDSAAADEMIQAAVLEDRQRLTTKERRRIIEANGVFAPGYPPHLLFTNQASAAPELLLRTKKAGDRYFNLMAAIPIDDIELRRYDRSVPDLIADLQDPTHVAKYPRASP